MPHVVIKIWPGRTEEKKQALSDKITQDIMELTECREEAVSVAIEEISPEDWSDEVYKPDIIDKADTLYKKPGYNPFEK